MPLSVWLTAQTSAPAQRAGRYLPVSAAHPAKMLPAVAAQAIAYYTNPGDLVLDPMCGIGTTLIEAIHAGRDALGVEYEPRWAHIARSNLTHATEQGALGTGRVYRGDARDLLSLIPEEHHGRVALVVTSPPYGNSLHGHVRSSRDTGQPGVTKHDYRYGTDPANLAHTSTDHLLAAFTRILTQCRHMLGPGGTVAITTRPWREHGELIDLPSAVLAAGEAAGLIPTERCIALLSGIRDGHLVTRPSFFQMKNVRDARRAGLPLHLIAHEDLLILKAPNGRSAGHRSTRCPDRPTPRARQCAHSCQASHATTRTQRCSSATTLRSPQGHPQP